MSMNNKKLITLALIDSKESRMEFLLKNIFNTNENLDDYFDKKVNNWKNNLKDLSKILVESNKIEYVSYLIYKYDVQEYVSFYTGYYNNIELFETGLLKNIESVLIGAIKNGHLSMIKAVLNKSDYKITTDLMIKAIQYNKREISEYLIEKSLDYYELINYQKIVENCIIYNNLELMKFLFSKTPNIDLYDFQIETAIRRNNVNMVKFLLEKIQSLTTLQELFVYAIHSKNLEMLKLFIYKDLTNSNNNSNYFYKNFSIAIKIAAQDRCTEIVKWCIEQFKNKTYDISDIIKSISISAAKNGDIDMIEFLFNNKYISKTDMNDIAFVAENEYYYEIVKFAVKNGADIETNLSNYEQKRVCMPPIHQGKIFPKYYGGVLNRYNLSYGEH